MKRSTTLIAVILSMALSTGAIVGCGTKQEESQDTSEEATTTTEQSPEEILEEFNKAIANAPEYTSVTIEETDTSNYNGNEDDGAPETLVEETVYKFDESGDQLRTSAEINSMGVKLAYYTDGDDVVFMSDGPAYSGTVDQFDLTHAQGVGAYLDNAIGTIDTIVDCVANVEKEEIRGLTYYTLTLDPQKYAASDEILNALAESGTSVKEATFTFCFDEDGSVGAIDKVVTYENSSIVKNLYFKDYNKTVVDEMPKATKTYEDMEADSQAKLDQITDQMVDSEDTEG